MPFAALVLQAFLGPLITLEVPHLANGRIYILSKRNISLFLIYLIMAVISCFMAVISCFMAIISCFMAGLDSFQRLSGFRAFYSDYFESISRDKRSVA